MYSITAREGADPEETGCRLPQHGRQQHGSTRRRPSHCAFVAGEHISSTSGVGSMVWVQWLQKSSVSPLINTDTYITAVQFLSARYCCCCECYNSYIYRTAYYLGLLLLSAAHGAPQAVEERAAQATTRGNSNGSDGRDTDAWIQGLGILVASTPVARTQITIPHHFGLMLLFSHSFFSCRQAQGRTRV